MLVVVNFSDSQTYTPTFNIPAEAWHQMGLDPRTAPIYRDLLNGGPAQSTLALQLAPLSAMVLELKTR